MIKTIIVSKPEDLTVDIDKLNSDHPVFAKSEGQLAGMVVKESMGWILKVGGIHGAYGHSNSLKKCIIKGTEHGYEFIIDENV